MEGSSAGPSCELTVSGDQGRPVADNGVDNVNDGCLECIGGDLGGERVDESGFAY